MKLTEFRWVNAIWSDDIRQEVGNKPSFMGVYTGGLVFTALPAILPRLAVWVSIHTPKSRPIQRLKVRVVRNDFDEPLATLEVAEMQMPPPSESETPAALSLSFAMLLGATQITSDTKWLKIFVDTEDEVLESFKLTVQTASSAAA